MKMKTVKLYTLGCKVNQYDTQAMREEMLACGYKEIDNGAKADVYLINTCTVTHKADNESLSFIRRARRENPRAKIIVAGCLARLDADKIKGVEPKAVIIRHSESFSVCHSEPASPRSGGRGEESKNLDPSSSTYGGLLRMTEGGMGLAMTSSNNQGISYFQGHTRAFLKIQDGCDNFCSYCRVPLARGRSRSKPLENIVDEAKRLVDNGIKEIVLSGVCLGAYGRDLKTQPDLADVISELEKIGGLSRVRLSSIEASDIPLKLIKKIASSRKLCRHLHIPIQSGDDTILKMMNRKYRCKDYLKLIRKIKKSIPGVAITTDILVGFPGETDDNFQNTADLIRRIKPLKAHIFPYSPRRGTAAFKLKGQVSPSIIKSRIAFLKKIAEDCSVGYRRQFLGKKAQVLIEARVKENPVFWEGHSDNYILVRVASKRGLKNMIIPLKIKRIDRAITYADFPLLR